MSGLILEAKVEILLFYSRCWLGCVEERDRKKSYMRDAMRIGCLKFSQQHSSTQVSGSLWNQRTWSTSSAVVVQWNSLPNRQCPLSSEKFAPNFSEQNLGQIFVTEHTISISDMDKHARCSSMFHPASHPWLGWVPICSLSPWQVDQIEKKKDQIENSSTVFSLSLLHLLSLLLGSPDLVNSVCVCVWTMERSFCLLPPSLPPSPTLHRHRNRREGYFTWNTRHIWPLAPTTNGGMQNGSLVGMCTTHFMHVWCRFACPGRAY